MADPLRTRQVVQAAVLSAIATLTLCQYPGLLATTSLVPGLVLAGVVRRSWLRALPFVLASWLILTIFGLGMVGLASTIALLPLALVLPGAAAVAVMPLYLWWVRPERSVPTALGYLAVSFPCVLLLASSVASRILAQAGQGTPPVVGPEVWLAAWHALALGWLVSRPRRLEAAPAPAGA